MLDIDAWRAQYITTDARMMYVSEVPCRCWHFAGLHASLALDRRHCSVFCGCRCLLLLRHSPHSCRMRIAASGSWQQVSATTRCQGQHVSRCREPRGRCCTAQQSFHLPQLADGQACRGLQGLQCSVGRHSVYSAPGQARGMACKRASNHMKVPNVDGCPALVE